MGYKFLMYLIVLASLLGFGFAAVSTYDSTAHLDRQVHGIHCSYFLGLGAPDASGETGCYATLMSPYSSMMRKSIWGGVPVALPAMSVFGFLAFFASYMLLRRKAGDMRTAGFLLLATCLPVAASIFMAYVAVYEVKATCKMCVGMYTASAIAFLASLIGFFIARKQSSSVNMANERTLDINKNKTSGQSEPTSFGLLFGAFALGVGFVVVPIVTYAALAPDFSHYIGNCGNLVHSADADRVLVANGPQNQDIDVIEVLDPLCAACGVFEKRFQSMPESKTVNQKVLLFPLDNSCNWMLEETIHPGSCAISEAVLCAGRDAGDVIDWATEHGPKIMKAEKRRSGSAATMAQAKFPSLKGCIGSAKARAHLNLALRWAVKNRLKVLTPQVFVGGSRVCDEDTDLGLEYALSRIISRVKATPPPLIQPEQGTEVRKQKGIDYRAPSKMPVEPKPIPATNGEATQKPGEDTISPPEDSETTGEIDEQLNKTIEKIDSVDTSTTPDENPPATDEPAGTPDNIPEDNTNENNQEPSSAPENQGEVPAPDEPSSSESQNQEEVTQ